MKSLGSSFNGSPSAASCAPNRLSVFATQPGGVLFHWLLEGATWISQPLAPVGSDGSFPNIPPQGEGICTVSSGPDRLEVFAAGSNGNTPYWWRLDGTTWEGPTRLPLPAGNPGIHPVPVAAVASGTDNIDVFAAGPGNTPWWWHWHGAGWSSPIPLLAGADLPPERIAAVSAGPGHLDVFAAGRAGKQLWHWWLAPGSGWRLEPLGGSLPAEGVSAVSWGTNRIDVFAAARLPDGSTPLQHWWSNGGGFSGPENLGGNLAAGAVSAVSPGPNRLDVFGISGDKQLVRWRWDGSYWSGPNSLGDNVPAGDVSTVFRPPNRIDVFVRGEGDSLLHWPGGGLENASKETWTNWPENHGPIAVAGHCRPGSLDELVTMVKEAEQQGRRVRAVGSSWSTSDIAMTPDYLVETDYLNSVVIEVLGANPSILNDPAAGLHLVHVEAGIKIHDLNILLDNRNLALKTLGGSTGQSLAGVLSTSVHGSDFDRGPIPDMVRAIHLVGPRGVQHWIEPTSGITDRGRLSTALGIADANIHYDDDWFNAVLVSMGSMGIIYSLILEVVPQYDLEQTCEQFNWDTMRARLQANGTADDPFAGYRAVQVVVIQFKNSDGTRTSFLTRRKEKEEKTSALPRDPLANWYGLFADAAVPTLNLNPILYPDIVKAILFRMLKQETVRGWAHTVMSTADHPPKAGLGLEIAFDATNDAYLNFVDEALQILDEEYQTRFYGLGGWMSLRFQGESRAYLSPQHHFTRTCTVEFTGATGLISTKPLLARLEAAGRRHGGIQHWGMCDDLRYEDVVRSYPRLDTWLRVRNQLTNNGALRTFDNDFMQRCGLIPSAKPKLLLRNPNDGAIYVIYGAAKFHVPDPATLERLFAGVPVRDAQAGELEHMGKIPGDGTLLYEETTGKVFVTYGGAKFHVPTWDTLTRLFPGFLLRLLWGGALDHIPDCPADGTFFREESSTQIYIIAGCRKVPAKVPAVPTEAVHLLWDGALAQFLLSIDLSFLVPLLLSDPVLAPPALPWELPGGGLVGGGLSPLHR